MKKILLTLAVASAAFLSACGGGSSDEQPVNNDKFIGRYVSCDNDHVRTVLNIDANLEIKIIDKVHEFSDCSGDIVAWVDYASPLKFNYETTEDYTVYGFPTEYKYNTTSVTIGNPTWTSSILVTGPGAVKNCAFVNSGTSFCFDAPNGVAYTAGLVLDGKVLLIAEKLVSDKGITYYSVTQRFVRQ